jgi:type II secretory ATPase GspE/PulE/Tfp pilus assembly ATPase PilB-like protein
VDVARADTVDADLDRLISRRASQDRRPDPDEQEEIWKASVRAHNDRQREEIRAAWCEYHQLQAERHRAVLEALISHHEERAAKLMDVQPKGAS